ncbi:hypothetical protein ASPWEDRAFT_42951 [Aspergillus wentii DTO 134E9]|uniref:Zn(2)-C6 fungal-type domain-containing protein n=1 Tax=Aspergillus wentii DTO 134E9 TaxID=1073089 RepID=A0A1L9RDJ8_ASPWE|nr:uncharacterized protein ASPWEDRAFT_42951 [Aspergillus wentii DTO 134E9]OJJ32923.1 hypothetical protein ASPWEDRAFT_42951 [Aspergillus wentii DTO 134E9]
MSSRRHRSTVACQHCRRRKVRCSLMVTGVPCIGCTQDGQECVIPPAKAPQRVSRIASPQPSPSLPAGQALHPSPSEDFRNAPQPVEVHAYPSAVNSMSQLETTDNCLRPEEERTGAEIANTVLGRSRANSRGNDQAPFYTGDTPGFGAVLDLCSPSQQPVPRHIMIPSKTATALSDQDREWLQYKGVFNLPRSDTCYELLRAYFHHVHPMMPVVDVTATLKSFPDGSQSNLLLIWSMFSVAANFVPVATWQMEGYTSRIAMKDDMHCRAKCLYHNTNEQNQTVLLQSALLLGFFHSETDMHTLPWLWTGHAISLCQTMGLHRCSASALSNYSIPDHQKKLWRRLWWTCFFRDRWLSLTMGRPLRINLNDCDTMMVSAEDMLFDLDVPSQIADMYIPSDMQMLAEPWVKMIQLSGLLGEVLTLCYQPSGPAPSLSQVKALEEEMLAFEVPDHDGQQTQLVTFSIYHLQLHYQAFLITFYRRFITKAPDDLPITQQESWQLNIRRKMDAAALQSNAILDNLAREKLIDYAGPMTPPLLVPVMHVHLLNSKSPDTLSRRLGLNKLDLCMMVLEQMQQAYPSASIFRGLFLEGIRQVGPEVPSVEQEGINISDDVIDALLDEASIVNLWESINGM